MWDHMWDEGCSAGVEVEVEVAGLGWRGNDTEELQQQ